MKWTLEDYTKTNGGYMRIFCDGEHAADVFPFAKYTNPTKVKERAEYMVAMLNRASES